MCPKKEKASIPNIYVAHPERMLVESYRTENDRI